MISAKLFETVVSVLGGDLPAHEKEDAVRALVAAITVACSSPHDDVKRAAEVAVSSFS